ncbi:MAG: response regulator transcription factor [Lachnospiraceae bacterium]|jgi:DNA-binding NarL/FixJ family response regulator|nr:response regulator transcription factor [Lachnospiraceae bacterium]
MKKIKVIIADDIRILRQGLKVILEQDDEIEVVAIAENGRDAFEKCKVYQPDVVVMDMRMPDYDGAYGINAIKEQLMDIKVLVLTTFDDELTIEKAIESGADGYILKEMEDDKVIAAVKNVYDGVSVFGNSVYEVMRKNLQKSNQMSVAKQKVDDIFSEKELRVIQLVAQGFDNKEIASEICMAEGSVRNMISKILDKLELKDRTQLAVYAVKHGLD